VLNWVAAVAGLFVLATRLNAQTEAALKEYFEGRTVSPKLALPGTEDGVDVYPGSPRPLDYSRYAKRLKDFGAAIKPGQPATITKVKLKSKLIEFQLDGGGYGTFGDETSSRVSTEPAPKTNREKYVEAELQRESDPGRKRALKRELDDLRGEREREDARNRAAVAEAEEHRKENIRQRRLEGGSRFNLRYSDRVPPDALYPDAVVRALEAYLDFGPVGSTRVSDSVAPPRSGNLRKGMLLQEVEALLGRPLSSAERKEGALRVTQRAYSAPMGQITAEFVEGVLIRYTLRSE
jgi:hypothetical protein